MLTFIARISAIHAPSTILQFDTDNTQVEFHVEVVREGEKLAHTVEVTVDLYQGLTTSVECYLPDGEAVSNLSYSLYVDAAMEAVSNFLGFTVAIHHAPTQNQALAGVAAVKNCHITQWV